jgi:hypothetical protein
MRTAIGLFLLAVLAACASVAAPPTSPPTPGVTASPVIIYVSPAPTQSPVVIYVTPAPTDSPAPTATPTRAPTPKPTLAPTPTPTLDISDLFDYETVTQREWAAIVRSPDDHSFETITVWGCISQFDTATGPDTFRAQASFKKQRWWYLDGDNSLFSALDSSDLDNFFVDDIFKAKVTVIGSYDYETTMGGTLTVPAFLIDEIELLSGRC